MNYLNTLPKELQNLVAHYANYDYWCCLNDIYDSSFCLAVHKHEDDKCDMPIYTGRRCFLRDCKIAYHVVSKSNEYAVHYHINLQPDQLITKNRLTQCIMIIINTYQPDVFYMMGNINAALIKYSLPERLICVATSLTYHKSHQWDNHSFQLINCT